MHWKNTLKCSEKLQYRSFLCQLTREVGKRRSKLIGINISLLQGKWIIFVMPLFYGIPYLCLSALGSQKMFFNFSHIDVTFQVEVPVHVLERIVYDF